MKTKKYWFEFLFILTSMLLSLSISFGAEPGIMRLGEVKKGDKGYGLTVFEGSKPEKFDFEVIDKIKQTTTDYVLVRLSGGPKDVDGVEIVKKATVIQGMSGSPVYIGDKILGAVSAGWEFSKDPIAIVTPIESMMSFEDYALLLPNKLYGFPETFLTFIKSLLRPVNETFSPGDTYLFCDVWGDDSSCGGGTITKTQSQPIPIVYSLGHVSDGVKVGPTAIPIWKGEVLTTVASFRASQKMIQKTGEMLGTVIFNGPAGQISLLGSTPRFFSLATTLENELKNKVESKSYLAFTPDTGNNLSLLLLSKKGFIFGNDSVESEVKIDITGMPQILIKGSLLNRTNAGRIVKNFIGPDINPTIERVVASIKPHLKYKICELNKATVQVTDDTDKNNVSVSLTIELRGENQWLKTFNLDLPKKYMGKKLHVSNGEEIVSTILKDVNFKPDFETATLLNQLSEKDALYLYYSSEEDTNEEKKEGVIRIEDLLGLQTNSISQNIMDLSKKISTETKKEVPANENGWTKKTKEDIKILYKIVLPSNQLVNGDKEFSFNLPEPIKKKKRFLIF